MRVTIHTSMDDLPATDWNGLAGDDPFLSHEFLAALEHCGSTTPETGWQPQHLACRDATGRLIGALPLYLKSHSYGEYVFDWSWAEAWQQAGLHYYPKLVSAVPFSPVPGQRLLIAPDVNREAVAKALLEASTELAQTTRASSIHSLFPVQNELPDWTRHGFLLRKDCQFHWHNHAKDHDFESWLARFTAHKRKKVHRERRRVREAGIRFRLLHGCDLDTQRLDTVHRFYAATYLKRGRSPYLNRQFFDEIARTLPENLLVILAEQGSQPVAAAICFRNKDTLYGRHWGCGPEFDSLHFETCYYQGIEYCLAHGLHTFNPGTQGEHKLARGFEPVTTWSAHWIAEPSLRTPVADFLRRETSLMNAYLQEARRHLPFHQNH